jgi:hypothetical protein
MADRKPKDRSLIIGRIRERHSVQFEREHKLRPHDRHLDALYEKIYFHEIDGRDKVAQRLQLPLVAFLAISGFVGSMLQSVQRTDTSPGAVTFWILLSFALASLMGAMWFLVVSLIGKKYHYLPVPQAWEDHQAKCAALYQDYEDAGRLVSAALQKNLVETYAHCGTVNGAINETKASYVFRLLRCLVAAALFSLAAYAIFFIAKLDKNLIKPTYRVEIVGSPTGKDSSMASQKPPPPPPPPPARQIKEDRPTPIPPPPPPKPGANNG